jgi:hypothetical protein
VPAVTNIDYGAETVNASIWEQAHNYTGNSPYEATPSVFNLTFDVYETSGLNLDQTRNTSDYSYLTMNVLWTSAADKDGSCPGTKTMQTCKLRPAIINYPVMIQNATTNLINGNADSMALSTLPTIPSITFESEDNYAGYDEAFGRFNRDVKQTNGFSVVGYKDVLEQHFSNTDNPQTYLMGIQQALSMYMGGGAFMYFDGTGGYQIHQTGNAQQYLTNAPTQGSDGTFVCGYKYMDPVNSPGRYDWILNNVILSLNQIMFTIATVSGQCVRGYGEGFAAYDIYRIL